MMPETDPTGLSLLPRTPAPSERIEIVYDPAPVAHLPQQRTPGGVELSDLQDATVNAADTVVASGKVSNTSENEIRVVLQAQGLPATWRPAAQVIRLPAHNTAKIFLYLTPPAGTTPGRYQWALTAETGHAPMRAASACLTVTRPVMVPEPETGRRPERRWGNPVALAAVLLVLVLAILFLHRPGDPPRPATPGPAGGPGERAGRLQTRDESQPITIRGKVFVVQSRPGTPVTASVTTFGLDDLRGSVRARPPLRRQIEISGNDWSVRLRPGLYRATFDREGCEPQSVLIDNLGPGPVVPPSVRLCAPR